jgi:hypothetical protein
MAAPITPPLSSEWSVRAGMACSTGTRREATIPARSLGERTDNHIIRSVMLVTDCRFSEAMSTRRSRRLVCRGLDIGSNDLVNRPASCFAVPADRRPNHP